MATMNISLPSKLKELVDAQVATGRYSNASDYIRDLVRRAQRTDYPPEVGVALKHGLASLGDESAFISHDEAMTRLDAAIDKAAEGKAA